MGSKKELIFDGSGLKIALVSSDYNDSIVNELIRGAKEGLSLCGILDKDIFHVSVPGAFEIPFLAQKLSRSKKFDALICLGCVIRGETSHYDLICNEVTKGIMQVSLETEVPIILSLVTTENLEQAIERSRIGMNNKGYEGALSAVQMCISIKNSNQGILLI